jgi:hypothetical protein
VTLNQIKKYLGVDPGNYVFFSTKRATFRGLTDNKAEAILKKVEPSSILFKNAKYNYLQLQ